MTFRCEVVDIFISKRCLSKEQLNSLITAAQTEKFVTVINNLVSRGRAERCCTLLFCHFLEDDL